MLEVEIARLSPDRFEAVMEPDAYERFRAALDRGSRLLHGRTLWNVNSAEKGGGVAELLHALLPYLQGGGFDTRWAVIEGDRDFFTLTKRLHGILHGVDGERLTDGDRTTYQRALAPQAEEIASRVEPGDVVVIHDPQPAGLIPRLKELGARVVWRCHIGVDRPNDIARMGWDFLRPAVQTADLFVFSRGAYAWEGLDEDNVVVLPPSIDAFSPKNQAMEEGTVATILRTAGILEEGSDAKPTFLRQDGSEAIVSRQAEVIQEGPPPSGTPLVTQVSRWDRLKDPLGVLNGFASYVDTDGDPHLILAGPGKSSVDDDPEEAAVLGEVVDAWKDLSIEARRRIHVASLPTDDEDENAAIVNALQRRSDLVVQKSLAEGFGLTVAEAMWKERPVVASRVGGIQDQVVHGENGLLIDDPEDLAAFGRAVGELIADKRRSASMGKAGHERVKQNFLAPGQLVQHVRMFERLQPDREA